MAVVATVAGQWPKMASWAGHSLRPNGPKKAAWAGHSYHIWRPQPWLMVVRVRGSFFLHYWAESTKNKKLFCFHASLYFFSSLFFFSEKKNIHTQKPLLYIRKKHSSKQGQVYPKLNSIKKVFRVEAKVLSDIYIALLEDTVFYRPSRKKLPSLWCAANLILLSDEHYRFTQRNCYFSRISTLIVMDFFSWLILAKCFWNFHYWIDQIFGNYLILKFPLCKSLGRLCNGAVFKLIINKGVDPLSWGLPSPVSSYG